MFDLRAPGGVLRRRTRTGQGADVAASTIHNMLELDNEYASKLDFTQLANPKVAALMSMQVLLLDEAGLSTERAERPAEHVSLSLSFFSLSLSPPIRSA